MTDDEIDRVWDEATNEAVRASAPEPLRYRIARAVIAADRAKREPLTADLTTFEEWYKEAIWGNEDFKAGCRRAWNAAIRHHARAIERAHGIVSKIDEHPAD